MRPAAKSPTPRRRSGADVEEWQRKTVPLGHYAWAVKINAKGESK